MLSGRQRERITERRVVVEDMLWRCRPRLGTVHGFDPEVGQLPTAEAVGLSVDSRSNSTLE